jgi:hypothetical protein
MAINTGIMTTTSQAALTAPGIEMWMEEEAKLYKPMFTQLFNLESASRLYEDDSSWAGIDYPEEVNEAAAKPEQQLTLGYTWRYSQRVYKRKVALSTLMDKTDLYGIVKNRSKDLSKKAAQGRDVNAFSVLRNAFSSSVVYGDGKSLVSVAHPIKATGGVQKNTFADGVQRPLTYENVKIARDQMTRWFSNSGMPLDVGLNGNLTLVTTPYNSEAAFQVLYADGKPGTADNDRNYIKGLNIDLMIVPFLGHNFAYKQGDTSSTDADTWDKRWFLMDRYYAKQCLKFKALQDFEIKAWRDDDTDVYYGGVSDIYAYGISNYLGVFGSLGDATTLST